MIRTLCPQCRKKLDPGQRIHDECVDAFAKSVKAKAEWAALKKVKQQDKERKEKLKRIPDYIKEAQIAFNAYIRARDRGKPCICCGLPLGTSAVGGDYDCGHFRSVGSASHLRYHEDNAHAQRKVCNRYGAGRAVDYRIGLIERIGLAKVEALETDNRPHKWTKEELIEIRAKYKAKLKEISNGQ